VKSVGKKDAANKTGAEIKAGNEQHYNKQGKLGILASSKQPDKR
jgi:hypothetical protein